MELNVDVLAFTFETAIRRHPDFVARFYDCLVQQHPEFREFFPEGTTGAQHRMLAHALASIIAHVDEPLALAEVLGGIGSQHMHRGVEPEHYIHFNECLIQTMAAAAAAVWTSTAEAHWRAALARASAAMTPNRE